MISEGTVVYFLMGHNLALACDSTKENRVSNEKESPRGMGVTRCMHSPLAKKRGVGGLRFPDLRTLNEPLSNHSHLEAAE
jgi:hypothetical protein